MLQKWFEHTCFVAKMIYTHFFLLQKLLMHFFCHKKNLRTFFCRENDLRVFFCCENDLRTSSGKFLRFEFCYPESSDFLGLCCLHLNHVVGPILRKQLSISKHSCKVHHVRFSNTNYQKSTFLNWNLWNNPDDNTQWKNGSINIPISLLSQLNPFIKQCISSM